MGIETVIGVDAYGGDEVDNRTAAERITAVVRAIACERPDIKFVVAGDPFVLQQRFPHNPENIEIVQGNDTKYGAIKKLAQMASAGDIHGFYTLEKTEILVRVVNHWIGNFPICEEIFGKKAVMPLLAELPKSRKSGRVSSWYFLDVGAVTEISPDNYVMYAQVGRIYARTIGKKSPVRVGLLNIGIEKHKGTRALKVAYGMLSTLLPNGDAVKNGADRFIGNVEPNPCMVDHEKGSSTPRPVDVVVTDAFTGNIMIKALAAASEYHKEETLYEIQHGGLREKSTGALGKPMFKRMKDRVNKYVVSKFPCSAKPVCKGHGTAGIDGIISGIEHLIGYVQTRGTEAMERVLQSYAKASPVRDL